MIMPMIGSPCEAYYERHDYCARAEQDAQARQINSTRCCAGLQENIHRKLLCGKFQLVIQLLR